MKAQVSDRRFGLSVAGGIVVVALLRWWQAGRLSLMLLILAGCLGILALILPQVLAPLNRIFEWGRRRVVFWSNALFLALAFYTFVTPFAVIMRALGHGKAFRQWRDNAVPTYFSKLTRQDDLTTMRDIF